MASREHTTISERHNQLGFALHTVEHPREHWPVKSPPDGPRYSLAMLREALQKWLPALLLRPVSACRRCGSQIWALHEAWMSSTHLLLMHMWVQKSVFAQYIEIDVL